MAVSIVIDRWCWLLCNIMIVILQISLGLFVVMSSDRCLSFNLCNNVSLLAFTSWLYHWSYSVCYNCLTWTLKFCHSMIKFYVLFIWCVFSSLLAIWFPRQLYSCVLSHSWWRTANLTLFAIIVVLEMFMWRLLCYSHDCCSLIELRIILVRNALWWIFIFYRSL